MNARSEQSTAPSAGDFPRAAELDLAFREALAEKTFSGANLLIGTPDLVLLQKCWGLTHSGGVPVDADTRFDLASLTKPLVTAALCIRAVGEGRFGLDDPIARFFPAGFVPSGKQAITVRQLLNHCSGFAPYHPYYRALIRVPAAERSTTLLRWILRSALAARPGTESHYSDPGFLVLGAILETALHGRLDGLARRMLFEPLAIDELAFRPFPPPTDPALPPPMFDTPFSFAATEHCPWRGRILQGEVHDENAWSLGGVAPHAGLFGTAAGVYGLLSHLWKGYQGRLEGTLFKHEAVRTFWTHPSLAADGTWALGFDRPSRGQSSAGRHFSPASVGHLGFTGTSFWLDPEQGVVVVLLTNRVHPTRRNERIKQFRPLVHNLAMKAYHEYSKH